MASVRFWDTSALVKVFDERESGHRRARGLWSGPRSRGVEHAISALTAVEAVRKFYRSAPAHVSSLMDALSSTVIVPLDAQVLPVAYEVAKRSQATGADTAIVASAVAVVRSGEQDVELVTADEMQAELARRQGLDVVKLP